MTKALPTATKRVRKPDLPKVAKRTAATKKSATRKKKTLTSHKLIWRDVTCRVRHTPNYISRGWTHIEIIVVKPKGAPLPITETGYRSHFMAPLDLINAGGPVTYVTAWIEKESRGKAWTKAAVVKAQGDLFSWADANAEVGKRKRLSKPTPVRARIVMKRGRTRAPE